MKNIMKTTLVVLGLLCIALSSQAQTASVNSKTGDWTVNVKITKAKDKAYKSIKLLVNSGVTARGNSNLTIAHPAGEFDAEVSYNKDLKIYTVVYQRNEVLVTKTVAAVKNRLIAEFYQSCTGKQLQ